MSRGGSTGTGWVASSDTFVDTGSYAMHLQHSGNTGEVIAYSDRGPGQYARKHGGARVAA